MDGGKAPIPDGALLLAQVARDMPIATLVDRVVLLQREDPVTGWTLHVKRLRAGDGGLWARSDHPDGSSWPIGEGDRVVAVVLAVDPATRTV